MDSVTNRQSLNDRQFGDHEGNNDHDAGLGETDQWRFTPSMLDPNSFAFTSFANQHSDGFTPNLGGYMGGVIHNQAGDVHTPSMAFGLGTPLSISTAENHSHSASAINMQSFHPHLLQSQPFQHSHLLDQQQSYAPSSFVHQASGYEPHQRTHEALPSGKVHDIQESSNLAGLSARSFDDMSAQPLQSMEKWVY